MGICEYESDTRVPALTLNRRQSMRRLLGLDIFSVCKVRHCYGSFAVAITFPDGFKFSYSGDCRPSRQFTEIGRNSTVLVHEATFDDELLGDARAKKHCTISEAINVAVRMQAKNLILTHFSQRFSKLPVMNEVKQLTKTELVFEDDEDIDQFQEMQPLEHDSGSNESSKDQVIADQPAGPDDFTAVPDKQESNGQGRTVGHDDLDLAIAVAFDYMTVRVKDIRKLSKFTPALVELYKDDEEAGGELHEQPSEQPQQAIMAA